MTSILKADTIQDSSGNNIINENANTITIGASGDTITIPAGATITNSGTATGFGGITVADVWRYTASTAGPSGDITSNLERADDASSGILGSGMTESSGIFSFPSTGIYMLSMTIGINFANEADNNANVVANVTINNSAYDAVAFACAGSNSTSNFSRFTVPAQALIDVTDTSNVKVKFTAASFDSNSYLEGSTTQNDTSFMFIRLGDT